MIRMCCVCHRVEEAGLWGPGPIEVASERVTHGFCPECYATVMAELDAYVSEKSLCGLAPPAWAPVDRVCGPCA